MKHILLVGCLLLLQACQDAAKEESAELSLTNPVAKKAVAATREDFIRRLGAEKKSDWGYADYISQVGNYNLSVRIRENRIYVEYLIKQPRDGSVIKGGGGRYEVDAQTGKIIEFEGYE